MKQNWFLYFYPMGFNINHQYDNVFLIVRYITLQNDKVKNFKNG